MLDYDQLADQIHAAVDGLGTDEQSIFHALERLQRDPAAITALKDAYRTRHRVELLDDLRDDLSGSELAYALALLGGGGGGSAAIGARPSTDADHDAAAQRIRTAVQGLGTDEEAIFAALMAYERNSGLVAQLKLRYSALYGEDLRARLVDELAADEFANAAYLMGEAALEQTELSPAQAARVFSVMATLTFTDTTGAQSPVPYHYPVDGCYARAQMMAQMLTRAGIASERVFATSTVPGGLHIPNQFSEDQPGGAPAETTWWYHVAPIVRVRSAAGAIEETVIDPSTQSGPVPIADVARGDGRRARDLLAQDARGADGAPRRAAARPDGGELPRGRADRLHDRPQHDVPRRGAARGLRARRRPAGGAEPEDDELRGARRHA